MGGKGGGDAQIAVTLLLGDKDVICFLTAGHRSSY